MNVSLLLEVWLIAGSCCDAQVLIHDFEKLHSLAGTWKMESSKGVLYESWQRIDDSTLFGRTFKINAKDTVVLEQVDLKKRGATIQYSPIVKDQNNNERVIFTLVKIEKEVYIFENKAHDFPQKVIYTLPKNNVLHASIEGNIEGEFRRVDYKYSRLL